MNEKLRLLVKALGYRHARQREWYIGHDERMADLWAQYETCLLLDRIREEWRRER